MVKETKSMGYKMGYILAATCGWCLTACLMASVIAAAIKFILWITTL